MAGVFGMDKEELADALESIYKRQKLIEERLEKSAVALEEIKTHILALRTTVVTETPNGTGEAADDGVPPVVKWILTQPWGTDLIHGLTDKNMIQDLVKMGFNWIKGKVEGEAVKAATGATKGTT